MNQMTPVFVSFLSPVHPSTTLITHNPTHTKTTHARNRQLEFDKKWTDETRREGRVGNWREFQKGPGAKRARVQVREELRKGTIDFVVVLDVCGLVVLML